MKRIVALMLALLLLAGLTACGKSEAAQAADDLIAAIGTVTLDSGDKIVAAEQAVNALTEEDAKQIENSAVLTEARNTYDALIAQKEAEEAEAARIAALKADAAKVDSAIKSIGSVTLNSQRAIKSARDAYNALSNEARSYVENLEVLETAEVTFTNLRVSNVENLIRAIGTVTLNSGDAIDTAQAAYNDLSSTEASKVSNVSTLNNAVSSLKQLKKQEAKKLLSQMNVEEDLVRGLSFYYPKAFPMGPSYWYADQRSFVLPYLGMQGDSVWLRLVCNYTAKDWVFFEKITYAVDGVRYYDFFSYWDVTRDNSGGKIWEYVDMDVNTSTVEMLWAIANSTTTIVRFEGDSYYRDVTISDTDKAAIRQMLTAYEALGGK